MAAFSCPSARACASWSSSWASRKDAAITPCSLRPSLSSALSCAVSATAVVGRWPVSALSALSGAARCARYLGALGDLGALGADGGRRQMKGLDCPAAMPSPTWQWILNTTSCPLVLANATSITNATCSSTSFLLWWVLPSLCQADRPCRRGLGCGTLERVEEALHKRTGVREYVRGAQREERDVGRQAHLRRRRHCLDRSHAPGTGCGLAGLTRK